MSGGIVREREENVTQKGRDNTEEWMVVRGRRGRGLKRKITGISRKGDRK